MDLTYIIPLCDFGSDDFEYRKKNVEHAIKNFLEKQEGIEVEILVVHQMLSKEKAPSGSITCYYYSTFNKPWLCNLAAKKARGKSIVIAESDVFVDNPNYLKQLNDHCRSNKLKWCFGWDKIFMAESDHHHFAIGPCVPCPGGLEGGIVWYDRDFYLNTVGGMNEWYEMWGGHDNDMARRCQFASGTYEMFKHNIYHLYHPDSPMKTGHKRARNAFLLKYSTACPEETTKIVKRVGVGDITKPACAKSMAFIIASRDMINIPEAYSSIRKDNKKQAIGMFMSQNRKKGKHKNVTVQDKNMADVPRPVQPIQPEHETSALYKERLKDKKSVIARFSEQNKKRRGNG